MNKIFRYKMDGRSKRITLVVILIMPLLTAGLVYLYLNRGAYFPAWFVTIALAVLALYLLSIPRSVRVTGEAFEIHCIVELTTIPLEDIRSVRRIPNRGTHLWLLLGSYGFFGYYGYYLDWKEWEFVKVYASAWDNLIEIEDIYEQRYVINCSEPDVLLRLLSR